MLWLKVAVAGSPEPLDFLLDSGAAATVLNIASAQRAGIRLGRRESVLGVDGSATAYRVEDVTATATGIPVPASMLAVDLSAVARKCGHRIDGLLGADFFRDRIVQIDYAAGRLRVLDRGEFRLQAGESLPLARRNGALCIRVGVNGSAPAWMRVDTGCSTNLEWIAGGSRVNASSSTSVGLSSGSARRVSADVQLGQHRLAGVPAGIHSREFFPGEAGLLGNGILSRFVVTIDAAKGQLLLAKK
jgi:hypothetical protein